MDNKTKVLIEAQQTAMATIIDQGEMTAAGAVASLLEYNLVLLHKVAPAETQAFVNELMKFVGSKD